MKLPIVLLLSTIFGIGLTQGFQTTELNALEQGGDNDHDEDDHDLDDEPDDGSAARELVARLHSHAYKYHDDHLAVIAKGLNPNAHSGRDPQRPLVHRHQFQHIHPESNNLIYFQYDLERHPDVTVLSAEQLKTCSMATNGTTGETHIELTATDDDIAKLDVDKSLLLTKGSCKDIDGTTDKHFHGKVVTKSKSQGKLALTARVAPDHTAFKYSNVEYYNGDPEKFHESRAKRLKSLAKERAAKQAQALSVAHEVDTLDTLGFALSEEIVQAAKDSVKAVEDERDRKDAARQAARVASARAQAEHRAQAQANHTVSAAGFCFPFQNRIDIYKGDGKDVGEDLKVKRNFDCAHLTAEDVKNGKCCWTCYDSCDKYVLFLGCDYVFEYKKPYFSSNCRGYGPSYYQYDMKVQMWDVDNSNDDKCENAKEWETPVDKRNPNDKNGKEHENARFNFGIPQEPGADCMNDGAGYPDFQLQAYEKSTNEVLAWFPNNRGRSPSSLSETDASGYFRVGTYRELLGKGKTIDLSFKKKYEWSNIEASFQCEGCNINIEGNTHVLIRTSEINPFTEAWIAGDVDVVTKIGMMAKLKGKAKGEASFVNKQDMCTTPICLPAMLGGVGVNMGARWGIEGAVRAEFEAALELKYDREFNTKGSFQVHWGEGFQIKSSDFSNLKTTEKGSKIEKLKYEVTAKAVAAIDLKPKLQFGLWASAYVADICAYAELAMELSPTLTAQLKYGSDDAALDKIPQKKDCDPWEFKFDSKEKPTGDEGTCCGETVPYCNDVCQEKHHLQMDIAVPGAMTVKIHAKAKADLGWWGKNSAEWTRYYQKGKGLTNNNQPFLTMLTHLASFCFDKA